MSWRELIGRALLDGSSIDDVEKAIADGSARLWERGESAAVIQQRTYVELSLAGGNLPELMDLLTDVEADAKAKGCSVAIVVGRKGWARVLPGYREMTVLVKELG